MATSWAEIVRVSASEICCMAIWLFSCTFAKHYSLDFARKPFGSLQHFRFLRLLWLLMLAIIGLWGGGHYILFLFQLKLILLSRWASLTRLLWVPYLGLTWVLLLCSPLPRIAQTCSHTTIYCSSACKSSVNSTSLCEIHPGLISGRWGESFQQSGAGALALDPDMQAGMQAELSTWVACDLTV